MKYQVLWIDDLYETQADFIGLAEQENIDIHPFGSHEEGIRNLKEKIGFYDAVILDANVKNRKDDIITGLTGFTASRDRLIEINKDEYLPFFIFTGEPDYKDATWFKQSFGQYFIKGEDNDRLLLTIKEAVDRKDEYIIKKRYKHVFEVCTEKYVGEKAARHLMDVLLDLTKSREKFKDEDYFNGLRKVIEYVFRASNKFGLLHDKCIPNNKVNLTWSSLFLAGKEIELKPTNTKISCSKSHFPHILANNVKSILDITSAVSHTEEQENEYERVNFSEYKMLISSNYLLYSLTFQVMDLLLWFKEYADENPYKAINKSLWLPSEECIGEWQEGTVINLNPKGFAFFKPNFGSNNTIIPNRIVSENRLSNSDTVIVTIEEYIDSKTEETRTRVKELKKIEI